MVKPHMDYTSDEARLPEGLERIAYDADRQVYQYRDNATNEHWEGEPGNQFGQLHRVPTDPKPYLFASDVLPEFVLDPLAELPDTDWEQKSSPAGSADNSRSQDLSRRASNAWRRVFRRLRVDLNGVEKSAAAAAEKSDLGQQGPAVVLSGESEKGVIVVEKIRDVEKDSMELSGGLSKK